MSYSGRILQAPTSRRAAPPRSSDPRDPAHPHDRNNADATRRAAACVAARDDERERLARELHDGLSAELTALRYVLARLAPTPPLAGSDATALADADAALNAAFHELRRLIDERSPPAPARDPIAHLQHWVSGFAQRIAIDITFECPVRPPRGRIDAAVAVALLRITQEALNNIAKHAGATAVVVGLDFSPTGTVLIIRDNGRGLATDLARQMHAERHADSDAEPGPATEAKRAAPLCSKHKGKPKTATNGSRGGGIGLSSMRERCEALGGSFALCAVPDGSGLEIRATLPAARLTQ